MSWSDRIADGPATQPLLEDTMARVAELPDAVQRGRTLAACSSCTPDGLKVRVTAEAVKSFDDLPPGTGRWSVIAEAVERMWPPAGDSAVRGYAESVLSDVDEPGVRARLVALLAEGDQSRWGQLLSELEEIPDAQSRAMALTGLPRWVEHEWGRMPDVAADRMLSLLEGIDPDRAARTLQGGVLPPPLDWPTGWPSRVPWSQRALPDDAADRAIAIAAAATDQSLATAAILEISDEHGSAFRRVQVREERLATTSQIPDPFDRATSICVLLVADWDADQAERRRLTEMLLDAIRSQPEEDAQTELLWAYAHAGAGGATHGHSEALAIAREITSPFLRARALAALANPVESDRDATLKAAEAIEDPEAKALAVFAHPRQHAPKGKDDLGTWRAELMQLAMGIEDPATRARYLCSLGRDYEPGVHPAGGPRFEEILAEVESSWRRVKDPFRRAKSGNLVLALLDGFKSRHPDFDRLSAEIWAATDDIPTSRRTSARLRLLQHIHGPLRIDALGTVVDSLLANPSERDLPDNLARAFGPWMGSPPDSEV
jgi:hypothetical protein